MRALLVTVMILVGCGGPQKPREPVATQTTTEPAPTPPPPADDKLTAEECAQLFDHIAELVVGSLEPQDREGARAELDAQRGTIVGECSAGRVTRAQYQCMTRAQTMEALNDCVPVE